MSVIALLILIVLSCAYVFEVTVKRNLGSGFYSHDEEHNLYLYMPTYVRGSVYVTGMIAGYFIFNTKQNKLKLSQLQVLVLWVFSSLALLGIVFAHSYFARGDFNRWEAAVFNSLSRVSWAFALSILIILCVNNYGGIINTFLSHEIFTVLIRLNYNVYLLHVILITVMIGAVRTPTHFNDTVGYSQFWGYYVYSLGAAYVWTLAFESPIIVIEKVLFSKMSKKNQIKN